MDYEWVDQRLDKVAPGLKRYMEEANIKLTLENAVEIAYKQVLQEEGIPWDEIDDALIKGLIKDNPYHLDRFMMEMRANQYFLGCSKDYLMKKLSLDVLTHVLLGCRGRKQKDVSNKL